MFKNRWNFVTPVAFIFGLVVASLTFSAPVPPAEKQPNRDTILDLLKERAEILKSRRDLVMAGHRSGLFDFDKVHEARRDYLHAKLDLSATNADRVAVLKEIVDDAESCYKVVAGSVEVAMADKTVELKAKAYVLEARIALARAQQAK